MRSLVALLFLFPLFLPTSLASIASVEARGPDEDGAYSLTYDATHASAPMRLDVDHDGATTTRDLGTFEGGTRRVETRFLPIEGPGDYAVRLVIGNETSPSLRFAVADGDGASRDVTITIPDAPTTLELTNDSVNADGKTKSPGEELITRATLADANGVSKHHVRYRIDDQDEGEVAFAATANATKASIELRFSRFPIAAGAHRLTLVSGNATATRTFIIRDVPATLENATLPPVIPDDNRTHSFDFVVKDKNGFDHPIETRIYRGSTRLDLPNTTTLTTEGAQARLRIDIAIPARFTPGAYRISVYDNGTLAGSAPFEVRPLPTFGQITAVAEGDGTRVEVNGSGEGFVNDEPLRSGRATLRFETLNWSLALRARLEGPELETRNGSWVSATVNVEPAGRHAWRLSSTGFDLSAASVNTTLRRWDGQEMAVPWTVSGTTLRVTLPPTIEQGRYDASATLLLPNGSALRASWSFEPAPWVRLALGEPVVNGSEARILVTNAGGVPIRRLVFEAENFTVVSLNGTIGQRAFDVNLEPGQSATLLVRLPDGALAPGAHAGRVRAFALAARA